MTLIFVVYPRLFKYRIKSANADQTVKVSMLILILAGYASQKVLFLMAWLVKSQSNKAA